ncbi:hypothetical protein ACHHYP_00699 [Achlya hypogyna]|uniref:Glycosyltransferase (GlcNAc) n=1 Tax=Achlya hypogyna TaxID=1202772 RepID=A0A1V9ZTZ4_ACHHY|nr:hypothetical protein ACHHYP_00699 [Achlya hypogyna]
MTSPRRRSGWTPNLKFVIVCGLAMVLCVMVWFNLAFVGSSARSMSLDASHLRHADPTPPPHRRIIVLIANYRDTLRCSETLDSIFKQAEHPERVAVSLYDQLYLHEGEQRCFDAYCAKVGETNCRRSERLRRNDTIDADNATGPTKGRYETEKGIDLSIDTFALAVDSHTVFIKHWDKEIISQWDSIENPKAIITVYPDTAANMPPEGVFHTDMTLMCHAKIQTADKDTMIQYSAAIKIPAPTKPRLMSQFAGGFNFGTATSALEVRNDPFTPYLFHGEEYSKAARLFTHGYDMYIPTKDICFHWYEPRKVMWEKDWGARWVIQQDSRRRIRHVLGLPTSTNEFMKDELDKFGLGTKRTMAQFIEFSSINPLAPYDNADDYQFDNCHELQYIFCRRVAMSPPRRRSGWTLNLKFVIVLGLSMVVGVMLFLNLSFVGMDTRAPVAKAHLRNADPTQSPHRRIIVLIANYRDTLRCSETLDSIFTQAEHPERVAVSLFDQLYLHEGEERCFDVYCAKVGEANCRRSERLRRNGTIDADQATGPTMGRYETEKGIDLSIDTFALAVDSHTLFIKHWDTEVISQWDSIGNSKAIITVYPDATTNMPPEGQFRQRVTLMCHAKIETEDKDSMIQYSASITVPAPTKPRLMSQFAGGFNFGTATSALEVRNDPHTPYLFHGEEYSKAARLFTHGYDMYIPTKDIVFHWYEPRKVMWEKDWGARWVIQQNSKRRIRKVLGLPTSSEEHFSEDIEKFSLGTKRTMAQFIEFSSINPAAPYDNANDYQFDNCHELQYVPYIE